MAKKGGKGRAGGSRKRAPLPPAKRPAGTRPRPKRPAAKKTAPKRAPVADEALPEGVVVRRTAEIDPADPLSSGTTAPLRDVWIEAARQARDEKRVVIDLVGEGRGVIAIPVAFKDEKEAMAAMRPALDVLVKHVVDAGDAKQQPVMVDLQQLRERLGEAEGVSEWVDELAWLATALSERELLCMYVFSPAYLLEFSEAIGKQQGFHVEPETESPGFYRLAFEQDGEDVEILWNWARAIGDVIAGGHAWSYFGLLLALAPQVAAQRKEREGPGGAGGAGGAGPAEPGSGIARGESGRRQEEE